MKIISHRGNLKGIDPFKENDPNHLDYVLNSRPTFLIEVDVWGDSRTNSLSMGHDEPVHHVDPIWVAKHRNRLILHCKNREAMEIVSELNGTTNAIEYFYHQNDEYTITSKQNIWVHPRAVPAKNSYWVINDDIFNGDRDWLYDWIMKSAVMGICTDYPEYWAERLK